MDLETTWRHIHEERRALASTLSGLDEAGWAHDSLCPGWTVKDVAAHVISNPQIGWGDMAGLMGRNLGRGYNSMIKREVIRLGRSQTPASILADFTTYDGSVRHVPTTTVIEPLIDALVHHQDILRPLGLRHDMAPDAAAVAADRLRKLAFLMGSRNVVKSVRMVATDIDWVRGSGPTLEGPMQELVLVCAGRARVARDLAGDGRELLQIRRGRRTST
jgi:uncharacterized protein (TIGR03083 family)